MFIPSGMTTHLGRCLRVVAAIALLCGSAASATDPDALARAGSALAARPRNGNPTYPQTVAWLAAHARAHAHLTSRMGGVGVSTSFQIQPTHFGCVLGILRASRNLTTGLTVGGGYLLALREVDRARIQVLQVAGAASCVELKGSERMALQFQNAGSTREPRLVPGAASSTFRVCFDGAESAGAAATALRHAADLCGGAVPISWDPMR